MAFWRHHYFGPPLYRVMRMAIRVKCPGCEGVFVAPEELGGRNVKCVDCGAVFKMPPPKPAPLPKPVRQSKPAASAPPIEPQEPPATVDQGAENGSGHRIATIAASIGIAIVLALLILREVSPDLLAFKRSLPPKPVALPDTMPLHEREAEEPLPNDGGTGWSLKEITDSWGPSTGWRVGELTQWEEADEIVCFLEFNSNLGMLVVGPPTNLEHIVVAFYKQGDKFDVMASRALVFAIVEKVMNTTGRDVMVWVENIADGKSAEHPKYKAGALEMSFVAQKNGGVWLVIGARGRELGGDDQEALLDRM